MSSGLHVVEVEVHNAGVCGGQVDVQKAGVCGGQVEVQKAGVCGGQVEVQKAGVCGGQVEVKAELSDGSIVLLKRTDEDLAWMMKKLVDSFPDDRETLSSRLLNALLKVRAAEQSSDPQVKVQEVNKLLNIIINLPCKISQSEPVLTFFEPSIVDQTVRKQGQTLRTEDQTLRTGDQIQRTENQTLRTGDQIQRTENQTLRTEDQIQRTEDRTLRTEDQTLRTEDHIQRTENQTFINKDQTRGFDQTFRLEEDLESRVFRNLGHSGMMGRVVKRRSFRHRMNLPPSCIPST